MDTTKESIMAVAMRLFAEKGLKLVTVREICKAANVNIALVNYYFRNKSGLYQACVERLFHENTGDELCAIDANVSDEQSWREAMHGWIFGVSRALRPTQGGTAPAAGFFRQEMVNPSPMCNLLRERYAIPVQNSLLRLIAMAVGDVREQYRWADSIWAQLCACVLRDSSWNPLFRPADAEAEDWSESVADFVFRQVMSGMKYGARQCAH